MNKTSKINAILFILVLLLVNSSIAQIAQWRGPERNGIFPDSLLLKTWPEEGPQKLFVTEGLGKSYSSTIATKQFIYTTGNIDTIEHLSCIDLDGNIVWQKPYGRSWNQSFADARCTPTRENDRIYVLSGLDLLSCFNARTGTLIWQADIHQQYKSKWDMFGVSESLLLVDDKIIVSPAGDETTIIALNKLSGELIWKSKTLNAKRSNISPILIDHCGKKYIISATQTHALSVDAENGKLCWTYHYNHLSDNGDNTTILANSPIYKDSCLWLSNGWDQPSVMLNIAPDGQSVSEKFIDQTFDNQNHGVVLIDGFLYGSSFTGRNSGKWVCMNWETGEIVWIGDFHNKGPIISADGMLYCLDEKRGNLGLIEASPENFKVISSFQIKEGKGPHWSRPSIYNGMLLIRHGDVMVAYDIRQ